MFWNDVPFSFPQLPGIFEIFQFWTFFWGQNLAKFGNFPRKFRGYFFWTPARCRMNNFGLARSYGQIDTFLKTRDHTGGRWMGPPKPFCSGHIEKMRFSEPTHEGGGRGGGGYPPIFRGGYASLLLIKS